MESLSKNKCLKCKEVFVSSYERFKHYKRCHSDINKLAFKRAKRIKRKNNKELCSKCGKSFRDLYNLQRHLSKMHESEINCFFCDYRSFEKELNQHYKDSHGITMDVQNHLFKSEDEFVKWKQELESETYSKYIKGATRKNKDGSVVTYYRCHRDGYFRSKGNNIRNMKSLGSNKIDSKCPSYMRVASSRNCVALRFVATHVGHSNDLDRLTLTQDEKDDIARQILLGIPIDDILIKIRNSINDDNVRRIHLITRKDICNVINSYGLNDKYKCNVDSDSHNKKNDIENFQMLDSDRSETEDTKELNLSCEHIADEIILNCTDYDDFVKDKASSFRKYSDNFVTDYDKTGKNRNDRGTIYDESDVNDSTECFIFDNNVIIEVDESFNDDNINLNKRKVNFIDKIHRLLDMVESNEDMESVLRHAAPLNSVFKRLKDRVPNRDLSKNKNCKEIPNIKNECYGDNLHLNEDVSNIAYEVVIE